MLFVMYGTNGSIPIRNAKIRKYENEDGKLVTDIERPVFLANFRPQAMTELQRVIAVKEFTLRNPKSPFGATPYSQSDVMGSEFATEDTKPNSPYTGHNPAFELSRFDTREDIPYEEQGAFTDEEKAELKAFTEKVLLDKLQYGGYIRLDDSLPKPWPNYPMEQGPGVAQKIIAAAREFGIPLADVIEFEKTQEKPREGVLSMAQAEIDKACAEAAEDQALSAVIPA